MPRPAQGTYLDYYGNYINLVKENDILDALDGQQAIIDEFLPSVSEEQSDFAYAKGKWTIKELLQHIIDTERIFSYRALSIARGEQQSLPGFDENEYAAASGANARSWKSLCDEFAAVRQSTILLFAGFSDKQLAKTGNANNHTLGVVAAGFVIVGHLQHHLNIIQERYL